MEASDKVGKMFIHQYARLGSDRGCVGFAINDAIFFSGLKSEEKVSLTERLLAFKINESRDGVIVFHDALPELMTNCQFLNPERDSSIAAYLNRNERKLTSNEFQRLQNISEFNSRNDEFIAGISTQLSEARKAASEERMKKLSESSPRNSPRKTAGNSSFDSRAILQPVTEKSDAGACVIS